MRVLLRCAAAVTIGALAAGCDLPPGPSTPIVTEIFTGAIGPQGANVYRFAVISSSTVSVRLADVQPSAIALGLGLGTPKNDIDCTLLSSNPSAVVQQLPQISVTTNPGAYCVQVFDTGSVSSSAAFSVIVTHS